MYLPTSSGKTLLFLGIVGSINGRGVFVSKYIGRLIATLLPLRWRILAVNVLEDKLEIIAFLSSGRYTREAGMWVCDLVRQKQTVTC
jgi:hypothetical protein